MAENNDLKGLGGWLVLVGLGITIAPIRMLITYIPLYTSIFTDGTWGVLTSLSSEAYHPLWAPILIGEIAINLIIVVVSVFLIYLFFRKHHFFPRLYIALMVVSFIFIPLDAWVVTIILPGEPMFDPDTTKEFTRAFVGSIIWIPYMLKSKRVKATFVENMPGKQIPPVTENTGGMRRI